MVTLMSGGGGGAPPSEGPSAADLYAASAEIAGKPAPVRPTPIPSRAPSNPVVTPSPSAAVATGDGSTDSTVAGIKSQLGGDSGPTTNVYGLDAATAGSQISLNGFGPVIAKMFTDAGINPSQTMPAAQLATALEHVTGPAGAALTNTIQQMLFYGGYYPSSISSPAQLQLGTFRPDLDTPALTSALKGAVQTGSPFGTYLTAGANYGKAQGILAGITGANANPVGIASQADTDAALRSEASTLFGHDPSSAEFARFNAYFNSQVTRAAQAKVNAQNPTNAALPDAGTLATAIGNAPQGQTQFQLPPASTTAPTQADAAAFTNDQNADQSAAIIGQVNQVGSQVQNAGSSTYTQAPSLAAAADQYLTQNHPGDVKAQQNSQVTKSLYSILAGN